jgi:trehalose-6-phosphatase
MVICLGDDVSDTDAFRMVRSLPSQKHCRTLPVGVIRAVLLSAQAKVCRCAGRV